MKLPRPLFLQCMTVLGFAIGILIWGAGSAETGQKPGEATQQIDRLIQKGLSSAQVDVAPIVSDEDFLRRITFDLTGTLPSPRDVTLFGLDPHPRKRAKTIDRLLDSPEYAANWARYWRDVIFSRATDPRSRRMQGSFEAWMAGQLASGTSWDQITTDLITATGDVMEAGNTALIVAHQGQPDEIAAETSRIFLGIQIQCANCHDHPTDQWKREQFHQLAAFFPRVRVRRVRDSMPRRFEVASFNRPDNEDPSKRFGQFRENPEKLIRLLDRNGDGKLTKNEVKDRKQLSRIFNRLLKFGDSNQDQALSAEEIKKLPPAEL